MTPSRNILLTPGPATTSMRVKQAQVVPDICPRELEFGQLQASIGQRLVALVHGEATHSAVLFAGSGTCAVEACISSVVPHDGRIMVLINGAYGQRILEMCRIHLRPDQVTVYETAYDEVPDPVIIAERLAADPTITHMAVVHHETTTGVLNPLAALSALATASNVSLIVDAMSSYAGIPIDLRTTACDFLIASSNKCLQGMPGISFVIGRNALLVAPSDYRPRSLYLDLYAQHEGFNRSWQMRFTPPVQVLYALSAALDEFAEETLTARNARYRRCWMGLVAGMQALGFALAVPHLPQSQLLTTFLEPRHPHYSFDAMHDAMLSAGFTIYPGKVSQLACFRLANIGQIDEADITAFLLALQHYLVANEINLHEVPADN